MLYHSGAICDWGCKSIMLIGFESWWYFLVERHVRLTASITCHSTKIYHPDSKSITIRLTASTTCRSTKKYHPDSRPIIIWLWQPQSHVSPLRNIIMIQSQSANGDWLWIRMIYLSGVTCDWGCKSNGDWLWIRIFLSGATCDWGCKSLMVIDFESGYFLVKRHVIEAVRV
jgi:hypothetical protein